MKQNGQAERTEDITLYCSNVINLSQLHLFKVLTAGKEEKGVCAELSANAASPFSAVNILPNIETLLNDSADTTILSNFSSSFTSPIIYSRNKERTL